jgi:hypothetical protein
MSQASNPSRARPSALRIAVPKPRNPLVAAAARRLAGAHGNGNTRQRAQRELARELRSLHPPSL